MENEKCSRCNSPLVLDSDGKKFCPRCMLLLGLGATLEEPHSIGGLQILCEIGRGGMGIVYKAYDRNLNRIVAVKVLPDSLSPNEEYIQQFKREARAAARISHSNITTIYNIGGDGDRHYIVMEYASGSPLSQLIGKGEPLDIEPALRIMIQILSGLSAAHQEGIIHRDVKPHNILINDQGGVKITDFGLARFLGQTVSFISQHGKAVGTPAYMSPEQCRGGEIDERTDIYSAGVVLYQMLTGSVPFEEDTPEAMIHHILRSPLPPPHKKNPNIPADVEKIIKKATAKKPGNRYSSADEMKQAIEKVITGESKQITKKTLFQKSLRWIALIIFLGALITAGTFYLHGFRENPLAENNTKEFAKIDDSDSSSQPHYSLSLWEKEMAFPIISNFYAGMGYADGISVLDEDTVIAVQEGPGSLGAGLIKCRRGDTYSPDDVFSPVGHSFKNPDGLVRLPDGRYVISDGQARAILLVPPEGGKARILLEDITSFGNPAVAPPGFDGENVNPGDILISLMTPPKIVAYDFDNGNVKEFIGPSFFEPEVEGTGALEFGPDNKLYVAWSDYWVNRKPPRIYRFDPHGNGEVFLELTGYNYARQTDVKFDIDHVNRFLYYVHAPLEKGHKYLKSVILRISLDNRNIELVSELNKICQNIELSSNGQKIYAGYFGGILEAVPPGPDKSVTLKDKNLHAIIKKTLGVQRKLSRNDLLRLRRLEAGNQGIRYLDGLENAENLLYLNLEKNEISDLSPLERLNQVEVLSITDNSEIFDPEIQHLNKKERIKNLDLSGTKIGDWACEYISSMSNLTELSLKNCEQITERGIKHLMELKKLEVLSLSETNITLSDPELVLNFPNLREIYLSGLEIQDEILEQLIFLPQLKKIDLGNTNLSNDDLKTLSKIPNLEEIIINNTLVMDKGMEYIPDFPTLRYLCLNGCG